MLTIFPYRCSFMSGTTASQHKKAPPKVHGHHLVPLVQGNLFKGDPGHHLGPLVEGGVVHQAIDATESSNRFLHQPLYIVPIGDVGGR